MATVYLARDVKHHRDVALKVLNPELGSMVGVDRFLSEIRVTARLQHPFLLDTAPFAPLRRLPRYQRLVAQVMKGGQAGEH